MRKVFKKSIALLLALLMVTFSLPLSAFASSATITISSNVTSADGVEIDDDVAFDYYVEINGTAYNGVAVGSDGKTYTITDGIVTVPYSVSAVINNVEDGTTYSVKRLAYDNAKYALIDEADAIEGTVATMDYFVTVDDKRTRITASEFNSATDNGNNLTVVKYFDAEGNEYDDAQVVKGYKINRVTVPSTTYSLDEYEGYAVADTVEEHSVSVTNISCTHYREDVKVFGKVMGSTYSYSNTLTGSYDGVADEAKTKSKTTSTGMGQTRTDCYDALIQNEYRVLYDHTQPFIDEGKMAVLANNTITEACTAESLTSAGSVTTDYDDVENTVTAFTEVTQQVSVYEAVDVESDKYTTFDVSMEKAPTGTFSVDFVLYGGTIPESFEGAEFEIKDVNGNVLKAGEDYTLADPSSKDISLPILGSFGYTQYIFSDLQCGSYTIQQTVGEAGYSVDKNEYAFEVQRDGSVVGDNFATSSFDSKMTALTNNTYSLGIKYKVFKNNGFSIKFAKVDQNYEAVSGAQFMMVERDELFSLLGDLAKAGVDNIGNLDVNSLLEELQDTDFSSLDVGTVIGIILSIVNLPGLELSEITIPAILTATSDSDGIVSFSNSSNMLNVVGTITSAGVSGEQLAEVLKTVFGSVIPEEYVPLLDTLASMSDIINVHTGVPTGKYLLIESEAPTGYERNPLVYTVDVGADGSAFATVGIAFPILVDTINTNYGFNLDDILVNESEFNSVKNTVGKWFNDFTDYQSVVIDYVVEIIAEAVGPETATEEFLVNVKDTIIMYNDEYDNLATAIYLTIQDVQTMITDEMTEDWCYFDTRIMVSVNVNIVDCQGNNLDFDATVTRQSDGEVEDKAYRTLTGFVMPFGDYDIAVTSDDGYELITDTIVDSVSIDSATGDYVCNFEYHTLGDAVTETVDADCTNDGAVYTVVRCTGCNEILSSVKESTITALGHIEVIDEAVEPTIDNTGLTVGKHCGRCGEVLVKQEVVDAVPSYSITIEPSNLGTTTIDDVDSTDGGVYKYAKDVETVTLTATPNANAKFVGWMANGKTLVSTDLVFTPAVLANIVYTPVFEKCDVIFSVTFVDYYGNVIFTQTVSSADDIAKPTAPSRAGYTFAGWSLTDEEIAQLNEATTITAVYEKNVDRTYTVTATGCTIEVRGVEYTDVATDVEYDTLVKVKKDGATSWKIGDVTVSYSEVYSFFVGADIEVTPSFEADVTATPTVANVAVSQMGSDGAVKATFLSTRSLEGFDFVNAGFVYGKGTLANVTLDDVDAQSVKAVYCSTKSNQFSLTYGLKAQEGTISARSFVAFVDENGDTQVIYADTQTFDYASAE
jgi:uncharacterized repeat protein (TIGR02543 family)